MTFRDAPIVYACECTVCNTPFVMGGRRADDSHPIYKRGEIVKPWVCVYCGSTHTIRHVPGNVKMSLADAFDALYNKRLIREDEHSENEE